VARIAGVPRERAGWFARLAYRFSLRRVGKVTEPLAIMAHHGAILAGAGGFEMALQRARRVDSRLKELAGIKAAMQIGCPF
jgi:hypothetical protein